MFFALIECPMRAIVRAATGFRNAPFANLWAYRVTPAAPCQAQKSPHWTGKGRSNLE